MKRYLITITAVFLSTVTLFAQSTTENYIKSTVYRKEIKEADIEKVQNSDRNQTINYIDGLGRPVQTIQLEASPTGKDIVTVIAYDSLGRQAKAFLPYSKAQGLATGSYIKDNVAITGIYSYYDDPDNVDGVTGIPFSEKEFDGSPLSKVIQQGAPGESWMIKHDDTLSHTLKFEEATNTAEEVRLWRVDNNGNLVSNGYYPENQLWINITKDENWTTGNDHTTREYKDKLGRVILKSTFLGTNTLSTYYVYDIYGNLRYVIPPKANGHSNSSILVNDLNALCYQYKYDKQNRMVEKKIPGKGWEYIVYNQADQPVLTQDALLAAKGEWLFTKYDALGRVVLTGIYKSTLGREALQTLADQSSPFWETRANTTLGYTNNHFPVIQETEVLTKNFYDDYDFTDPDKPTTPATVYGKAVTGRTKGLTTAIWVKVLDGNPGSWNKTYTYYDEKARPLRAVEKNWMKGYTITDNNPDFIGQVLETTKKVKRSATDKELKLINKYDYDHEGRLKSNKELVVDFPPLKNITSISINNDVIEKTAANGSYSAGASSIQQISGNGFVEWTAQDNSRVLVGLSEHDATRNYYDINYAFYTNIGNHGLYIYEKGSGKGFVGYFKQGDKLRVERINNTIYYKRNGSILYTSSTPFGGNLVADFSMYYVGDKIVALRFAAEETLVENQYDELGKLKQKKVGNDLQDIDYKYNIRGWLTRINNPDAMGSDLFAFKLGYDNPQYNTTKLYNGNISEAIWRTANTDKSKRYYTYRYDALNRITQAVDNMNRYSLSSITYDKNGNIKTLQRRGNITANPGTLSSGYGLMDNLTYVYANGGQSNQLVSVTDHAGVIYGFKDGNTSGNDYAYDANGNLTVDKNKGITQIAYNYLNLPATINMGSNKKIVYLYSAAGAKLRKQLFENNSIIKTVDYQGDFQYENGILQFIAQPEGYIYKDATGYRYVYQYKDHLGNNRLSFMRNAGTVAIVKETNYYPFGLTQKGYNNITTSLGSAGAKKYQYNGKELQDGFGLDWYDYGARFYDASLGRWFVPDPMTEKYYNFNPYMYVYNNPIRFIDPDGNDGWDFLKAVGNSFTVAITVGKQIGVETKLGGKPVFTYYQNSGSKDLIGFREGKITHIGQDNTPTRYESSIGYGLVGASTEREVLTKTKQDLVKVSKTGITLLRKTKIRTETETTSMSLGIVSFGGHKTTITKTDEFTGKQKVSKSKTKPQADLDLGKKLTLKISAVIGIDVSVNVNKVINAFSELKK